MQLERLMAGLTELFALCALAALTGALIEDERSGIGLHAVFGLAIAACVARMAFHILGR